MRLVGYCSTRTTARSSRRRAWQTFSNSASAAPSRPTQPTTSTLKPLLGEIDRDIRRATAGPHRHVIQCAATAPAGGSAASGPQNVSSTRSPAQPTSGMAQRLRDRFRHSAAAQRSMRSSTASRTDAATDDHQVGVAAVAEQAHAGWAHRWPARAQRPEDTSASCRCRS